MAEALPLTAEEEARERVMTALSSDWARVWATLDAARAELSEVRFLLDEERGLRKSLSEKMSLAHRHLANAELMIEALAALQARYLGDSYKAPDAEAVLRTMLHDSTGKTR